MHLDLRQMARLPGLGIADQPLVAFGHGQVGVHRGRARIGDRRLGQPGVEPLIDLVHVFDFRDTL